MNALPTFLGGDTQGDIRLAQTIETVKEVTGLDIVDIMRANTYDAKVTRNINVTGVSDAVKGTAQTGDKSDKS